MAIHLSPCFLLKLPSPIAQSVLQTSEQESLVQSLAQPISFPRIDDSHSSVTAVHCFNNGYLGKQPVAWKEYCAEYWLKELQESMDRCTGHSDITEVLLKMALNTIQSIIVHKLHSLKLWNNFYQI